MEIRDDYNQHVRSLRQLSMACRTMWLRLVPWVWERLEISISDYQKPDKTEIFANVLRAETFLATSIRYFCALLCP